MTSGFTGRRQAYFEELQRLLLRETTHSGLLQTIVDAPFKDPLSATYLDLGITVLLLVDEAGTTIKRVALSNTEHAAGSVRTSEKPFHAIEIPLSDKKNIIAHAIKSGVYQRTEDWKDLFVPALTPESARFNQAGAGIAYSIVQPLNLKPHPGAMIFSFYKFRNEDVEILDFTKQYARLVEQALQPPVV